MWGAHLSHLHDAWANNWGRDQAGWVSWAQLSQLEYEGFLFLMYWKMKGCLSPCMENMAVHMHAGMGM